MTSTTLTIDQALQQAINHHQAGQLPEAEKLYRAILQAQPQHPDANHNLGVLAVSVDQPAAALPFLKTALEANLAQGQYWLSYVDALIRTGQTEAARQVLTAGQQKGLNGDPVRALEQRLTPEPSMPDVAASAYATALEHREAGRYQEAFKGLQAWLLENAQDAQAHALLAHVLLLDKQDAAANHAIERALSIDPALPVVQRNHARLLLKQQQMPAALLAAQSAYQNDPKNPESWLVLAAALSAGKQDAQALPLIEKALETRPKYAEAYASRSLLKLRASDAVGALADVEKALSIKPHLVQLWGLSGTLHHQLKNLPDAIKALQKALEYEPDNMGHMVSLGEFLRQNHQLDAAIALLEKVTSIAPENANAWANLGTALHSAGKLEKARDAYEIALKIKPDMAEVANNLGAFAKDAESWERALSHFERALEYSPKHTQLLANKGMALLKLKRPPEEIEAVARQILAINPEDEAVFKLLGELCKALGRLEDAAGFFRRSLKISPNSASINTLLGGVLKDMDQLAEAEVYFRCGLDINPNDDKTLSSLLFTLSYTATGLPLESREEAQRYGELVQHKANAPYKNWHCEAQPQRLRIGFVSGDFRNHPVGYFIEAVLSQIDHSKLEIIAYPTQIERDALTERILPFFAAWTPLYGKSDEAAALQIHNDGIHLLLDLSGHTGHNRLAVFAYKPAPVQASWLGYFATTGVAQMDWLIGDPYVTPFGEDDHFSEAIWRLPESYLCFTPPDVALEVSTLPALTTGYVTFGCFNNLAKMNDAVVALWARVLSAIPDSQLFLKGKVLADASMCERTRARFAVHGIDENRLILEGPSPRMELLAAYQRVDLALDPFPYPGGTTSAEALWMGVPVLTRCGDRFLSHVGESIAHNADLPDWIASDDEEYVAKAIAKTADLQKLAALRAGLRSQVLAAPLFDAPRFTRNFETALWGMWQRKEQHS